MGRVIAKRCIALVALLMLVVGACSDDDDSVATATMPTSTRETGAPTLPTTSTPATESTISQTDATEVLRSTVPTGGVPASTTSTLPVGNTSVPGATAPERTTTVAPVPAPTPAPTSGGVVLADMDCTGTPGSAGYDLLHVTVESLPSRYRFTAQYSGNTVQHAILVSFDLGPSSYLVTGELFEDGSGVPRITGADSSEDVFLDPPQTIRTGLVDLMVRSEQISRISGTPFGITVSLKVDGAEVETCT